MSDFEVIGSVKEREKWLELRRDGIGASECASILGLNPWSSGLKVYADKIGMAEEEDQSEPAYWGSAIEPLVIERFSQDTGRSCRPAGELLRSTVRPWQLATLDAEQTDPNRPGPGVLEVKCTALRGNWDAGIPPYVTAQVQHQLAVTGYQWGSVAVLFGGNSFFWADIERDEQAIAHLNEVEAEFWARVQNLDPPDPDGSEASEKALKFLYPTADGSSVKLDGEWTGVFDEIKSLGKEATDIEKHLKLLKNKVKAELGSHTRGLLPNGNEFTLTETNRAEQIVKASTFRTLRLKGN